MTIYEFLSLLVTLIGIAAACGAVYLTRVLYVHYSSDEALESVMDEWAMWAEAEQDRRAEARMCPGYATSALNYYGPRVLIERRLFLVKQALVWKVNGLRVHGLRLVLRSMTRNAAEVVIANNMRRYMNGRMGYGWRTKTFIAGTSEEVIARFPRMGRAFDRVQEFIFA